MTAATSSTRPELDGFTFHADAAALQARRRAMMDAHPELRQLIGPSPISAIVVLGLVIIHLAIAALLRAQPVWVLVLAAACPGAWFAASLMAMIHDAAHGLMFRSGPRNRIIAILANAPLVMPVAMAFFHVHKWHHTRMGDYRMDVGIPTQAEAAWVRDSAWRKAVWLAAFPLFQWLRMGKFRSPESYWTNWMIANLVAQVVADAALFAQFGWRPMVYLLLSYGFSVGFHPLGTRVVQEHVIILQGEETNNYAGPLCLLECNFGLHAEHHDFPRVAWHRLPQVSRIAAGFYETTPIFRSRTALLIRFITDPRYDLRNHAVT